MGCEYLVVRSSEVAAWCYEIFSLIQLLGSLLRRSKMIAGTTQREKDITHTEAIMFALSCLSKAAELSPTVVQAKFYRSLETNLAAHEYMVSELAEAVSADIAQRN